MAGCGLRSLHRAYEAAPHAYRRAGEGSTLFWHGTCAAHEKASPSLHAARTLDVGRSTSCRRKCQHTGVPVLEEDRVLGGDRAPGVRVCPDTDVPGHCGRGSCSMGEIKCGALSAASREMSRICYHTLEENRMPCVWMYPDTGLPRCGRVPLFGGCHTDPPASLARCYVLCGGRYFPGKENRTRKGGKRGIARYSARVSAGLSCVFAALA